LPIEEAVAVPWRSKERGVMHACGHDAHATVGVATALLLWRHRAELPGTVLVVFQPAEEGPPAGEKGGAPLMLQEHVFAGAKPSAMFALHAMPSVEVGHVSFTPGAEMASSDRFAIDVVGKGTHGATSHLGVDPIVAAAHVVTALQTVDSRAIDPKEPVVVTVGSFHAGTRFNIIPDKASLEGTVRALSPEVRKTAKAHVERIAQQTAAAFGARADVRFDLGVPVLVNDDALTAWAEGALTSIVGAERVHREAPRLIAEDFAYFAEEVPSFYFYLGVGNRARGVTAALHTSTFDIDEDALVVGASTMSRLVTAYLLAPPARH
jgi:amidohydrolase